MNTIVDPIRQNEYTLTVQSGFEGVLLTIEYGTNKYTHILMTQLPTQLVTALAGCANHAIEPGKVRLIRFEQEHLSYHSGTIAGLLEKDGEEWTTLNLNTGFTGEPPIHMKLRRSEIIKIVTRISKHWLSSFKLEDYT